MLPTLTSVALAGVAHWLRARLVNANKKVRFLPPALVRLRSQGLTDGAPSKVTGALKRSRQVPRNMPCQHTEVDSPLEFGGAPGEISARSMGSPEKY